jgi:hypothetical protein
MKRWLPLVLGLLAVLSGAVWTLQGLGHVDGSPMTGVRLWAVVGPVVMAVGLVLIVVGVWSRRRDGTG